MLFSLRSDWTDLDWEDFESNIQFEIEDKYPSFNKVNMGEHEYREQHVILENRLCRVSVSEYSGCGAVSVYESPKWGVYYDEEPAFAEHWIGQVFNPIMEIVKQFADVMYRVGGFSDGSSVYQLAESKDTSDSMFPDKRGEKL